MVDRPARPRAARLIDLLLALARVESAQAPEMATVTFGRVDGSTPIAASR
jgi:hypothetical protein